MTYFNPLTESRPSRSGQKEVQISVWRAIGFFCLSKSDQSKDSICSNHTFLSIRKEFEGDKGTV